MNELILIALCALSLLGAAMSSVWILIALFALTLCGVCYEFWRCRAVAFEADYQRRLAHERGWQDAARGLARDDCQSDWPPAEIEAWRAGWDEYHEENQ